MNPINNAYEIPPKYWGAPDTEASAPPLTTEDTFEENFQETPPPPSTPTKVKPLVSFPEKRTGGRRISRKGHFYTPLPKHVNEVQTSENANQNC